MLLLFLSNREYCVSSYWVLAQHFTSLLTTPDKVRLLNHFQMTLVHPNTHQSRGLSRALGQRL
jgi:hypothetical protein